MTDGLEVVLIRDRSGCCIHKTGALNTALTFTSTASAAALHGNAIAKTRTGNGSARALGATGSIAIAATGRKIE